MTATQLQNLGVPAQALARPLIVADGLCPAIAELLAGALHESVALVHGVNPLEAMADLLGRRRELGHGTDTLHLVAHGRSGAIQIGGTSITAASLTAQAETLAQWQVQRIALWSCEVGQDAGFIALLAELTGAQVWATAQALGQGHPWSLPLGAGAMGSLEAPFQAETLTGWEHRLDCKARTSLYRAIHRFV